MTVYTGLSWTSIIRPQAVNSMRLPSDRDKRKDYIEVGLFRF
jgi:hypothetical protein